MSGLRTLLQDADPVRHETPRLDAERDRIRQAIVRIRPVTPQAPLMRSRLVVAITVVVLVVAAIALSYQVWTTPVLAAVRFEVRLAEYEPTPGLVVARMARSDGILYLHPEVVVNNDDIAQSWIFQDGPGFGIAVKLLESGAERMRQATTAHLGRPVAVLLDGAVVMAVTVRAPISDSAMITGGFPRADAERIVEGINQR